MTLNDRNALYVTYIAFPKVTGQKWIKMIDPHYWQQKTEPGL